jgi:hypothetical protein
MLIARVFIVCLIISRCAAKEFSITPLEDALCCNLSYYTLENITLDDSSDTTIELIFHPGNHRLLSKLEIVNKDSFSLSSLAETNILCSNNGGILLANINHAEISKVVSELSSLFDRAHFIPPGDCLYTYTVFMAMASACIKHYDVQMG